MYLNIIKFKKNSEKKILYYTKKNNTRKFSEKCHSKIISSDSIWSVGTMKRFKKIFFVYL